MNALDAELEQERVERAARRRKRRRTMRVSGKSVFVLHKILVTKGGKRKRRLKRR